MLCSGYQGKCFAVKSPVTCIHYRYGIFLFSKANVVSISAKYNS